MPRKAPQNSGETARKPRGRPFRAGQSGNPGGRPKGSRAYLVGKYGEDGEKLYARLDALRSHPKTPAKLRVDIDMFLIERLHGKTPQAVELTGAEGGPVRHHVRITIVKRNTDV